MVGLKVGRVQVQVPSLLVVAISRTVRWRVQVLKMILESNLFFVVFDHDFSTAGFENGGEMVHVRLGIGNQSLIAVEEATPVDIHVLIGKGFVQGNLLRVRQAIVIGIAVDVPDQAWSGVLGTVGSSRASSQHHLGHEDIDNAIPFIGPAMRGGRTASPEFGVG